MRTGRAILVTAVLGCALCCARAAIAQGDSPEKNRPSPEVVTERAFSAVKYTRTVRVQPDGRRTITSEGHHMLLARDADGRIYMAGADVDGSQSKCDLPSLGKLPRCAAWTPLLFDPEARTMWHWMEGESGEKTQLVQMDLRDDQIAEAERLTSALEKPPADKSERSVSVQKLGQRDFEGIPCKGVRTTVMHEGHGGKPRVTIHEVWTSAEMHLVLRVVDGDPAGEESIAGLNHISLSPDPSLFHPAKRATLNHLEDSTEYAGGDLKNLSQWLVK